MPNPMYKHQMPTEVLKDEIAELKQQLTSVKEDLSWTLSELGHEHWQNCDLTSEDCYLCAGYQEIKEKYKDASTTAH